MSNSTETKVLNLLTGEEQLYSCDPEMAVKSAYAHANGYGTQFAATLGKMEMPEPVLHGKNVVSCGDWTALRRSSN